MHKGKFEAASAWLNILWTERITAAIPTRIRAKALKRAANGDDDMLAAARSVVVKRMTDDQKRDLRAELVATMPREARRALGERTYSQSGRTMSRSIRSRYA